MIRYLRLTNFRRHVETELRFEDGDHVVLVSGSNGVGKSTLFEAVLYALYGEGRNGRGNVERLIRKGGELEGLEVELHFEVANDLYQVRRRRDSKLTTALLFANDVPITEGAREVTAEVTKLLGMDAKGFRLAAYAQQRELDGLASMRPSERGQMLSRLLRLDVISRAKEVARAEFRQRRDLLKALGDDTGIGDIEAGISVAGDELVALEEALGAARNQITTLDAEIAAAAALESAYQVAVTNRVRLNTLVQTALDGVQRLEGELAAIVIPEPIATSPHSIEYLRQEASAVERLIAHGEHQQKQSSQLRVVRGELERCETRLDEIDRALARPDRAPSSVVELVDAAREALATAEAERQELRERYAAVRERVDSAKREQERASGLESECDACGQSVPEEHRLELLNRCSERYEKLLVELDTIKATGMDAQARVAQLTETLAGHTADLDVAQRCNEERGRLEAERIETIRRRDVYAEQIERIDVVDVDLSDAYARRAEIAVNIDLATQAIERETLRGARIEQQALVERALVEARSRLVDQQQALKECEVSADLELAHQHLQEQVEARHAEIEIAGELQAAMAAVQERIRGLERELERARAGAARRNVVDGEAQVALWSSQVLERVESVWAQQVRPSLEGTVSELVMRLSDGRFDAVSFDAEYNVAVRDRGVMRPIVDLSGGEIDLVALAVRLGLASIVSERHGAGGVGFLILDECFGSQDPGRRTSIMNALRGLRTSHGQIFLISHVGGLEDAADAVIEVELDEDANAVAVRA